MPSVRMSSTGKWKPVQVSYSADHCPIRSLEKHCHHLGISTLICHKKVTNHTEQYIFRFLVSLVPKPPRGEIIFRVDTVKLHDNVYT